jgi:hypothetical protein
MAEKEQYSAWIRVGTGALERVDNQILSTVQVARSEIVIGPRDVQLSLAGAELLALEKEPPCLIEMVYSLSNVVPIKQDLCNP